MPTIQIVGIAVAAVIVVLLVVALIVTRKGGTRELEEPRSSRETTSFLDAPPSDTLAKLGAPERESVMAATPGGPAASAVSPSPAAFAPPEQPQVVRTATGVASAAPGTAFGDAPTPSPPATPGEDETTGELPAVGQTPREHEPAATGEARAAPAPATADKLVPLSSIIVTTSTKLVDLDDPEIRRMLTDLVTFEIDQATQFRAQGQNVDAMLQLTEAEQICRALGRHDTAREIRAMMRGLEG